MKETILIVDDSTFIVEGLVALLKKSYNPIPSFGGEECLSLLRTVTPSLIILDIMMEPMDGWETLARIKENQKTRHIPVLMFSAKKISPEEAETHRIIIDDFITKPVNPKKLLDAIGKVLARQESNRKILGAWNAAGVSPEIIDEYLALKTNLDVDVSLLAVMQKQLGIAYPDAPDRQDLVQSIAAIEERIGVSRSRIEVFCRERAGLLPVLDRADASNSLSGPEPEPGSSSVPVRENAPEPAPVPPPVTGETPLDGEQPAAVSAPVINPPPGLKPESHPLFALHMPVSDQAAQEPVSENPVLPECPSPEAADGETPAGLPDSHPLFEPFEAPAEPVPRVHRETEIGENTFHSTPQARPRIDRKTPPVSLAGAGTDTPRMQSPAATRRVQKEQRTEQQAPQSAPASPGGFISRIIAAITSVFRKKKQLNK